MPCDSSHLEPTEYEVEGTKLVYLLEEIDTGKKPDPAAFRSGMHQNVYGKISKAGLDRMTAKLCRKLKALHPEGIESYSLEMQLWWRDHQEADRQKEESEKAKTREMQDFLALVEGMSDYHLRLLRTYLG